MSKSCFVIMAIGDQKYGEFAISASELRSKYDDLIKESLLRVDASLDTKRADDVTISGSINTEIVSRIMHSDIVIADITYPNPNVFYELGLRHAYKPGVIIIKDRNGPQVPFDVAHLRYVEYENTPTGLKALSETLARYIASFSADPDRPDNHFLEFAKYTKQKSFDYSDPEQVPVEAELMLAMFQSPELIDMFIRQSQGEEVNHIEMIRALAANPSLAAPFVTALAKSGQLSPEASKPQPENRQARRSKKKQA